MKAVVIYESMFGATKAVAQAVADGLSTTFEAQVVRAADASPERLREAALVCVGAPTQAHGLPRPSTRSGAEDYVRKSHDEIQLEPGADVATGVREWLDDLGELPVQAAAFDTKVNGPTFLTGRASRGIARRLKKHGALLVAPPESFLVAKNRLLPEELERATAWGEHLASDLAPSV